MTINLTKGNVMRFLRLVLLFLVFTGCEKKVLVSPVNPDPPMPWVSKSGTKEVSNFVIRTDGLNFGAIRLKQSKDEEMDLPSFEADFPLVPLRNVEWKKHTTGWYKLPVGLIRFRIRAPIDYKGAYLRIELVPEDIDKRQNGYKIEIRYLEENIFPLVNNDRLNAGPWQ